MRKLGIYIISCFLTILSGYLIFIVTQTQSLTNGFVQSQPLPVQAKPLKYVIFNNTVDGIIENPNSSWRRIDILLDVRSFSEENLRTLSGKIFEKYPNPATLTVSIVTSFDQIPIPDAPKLSEQPDDPDAEKHARAILNRSLNGVEVLRYTPNPPSSEMKLVILKGDGK